MNKIIKKLHTLRDLMLQKKWDIIFYTLLKPLIPVLIRLKLDKWLIKSISKNIKLVCIASHGVGQSAFNYWLYCLGLRSFEPVPISEVTYFNGLLVTQTHKHNHSLVLMNTQIWHGTSQQIWLRSFKVAPNTPTICLVRDPISILKSHINHHRTHIEDKVGDISWDKSRIEEQASKVYFEQCNFEEWFRGTTWSYDLSKPSIKDMLEATFALNCIQPHSGYCNRWISFTSSLKMFQPLIDFNAVWFIDMKELVGKKACETMKRVANLLQIQENIDFTQFGQKISGAVDECLPHTVSFNTADGFKYGGEVVLTSRKYLSQGHNLNSTLIPHSLVSSWRGGGAK